MCFGLQAVYFCQTVNVTRPKAEPRTSFTGSVASLMDVMYTTYSIFVWSTPNNSVRAGPLQAVYNIVPGNVSYFARCERGSLVVAAIRAFQEPRSYRAGLERLLSVESGEYTFHLLAHSAASFDSEWSDSFFFFLFPRNRGAWRNVTYISY